MPGRSRLSAACCVRASVRSPRPSAQGVACHLSAIQDATPDGELFPIIDIDTLPDVALRLTGSSCRPVFAW